MIRMVTAIRISPDTMQTETWNRTDTNSISHKLLGRTTVDNVRLGSLAVLNDDNSQLSAFRHKAAVIRRPQFLLCLCLLGQFQGVVDFDAQVANGAVELGVSKQKLYRSEILRTPIDERRLGAPQRMRSIGRRI